MKLMGSEKNINLLFITYLVTDGICCFRSKLNCNYGVVTEKSV